MLINRVSLKNVGSTNTWGKEHVEEFDCQTITVITAEEQTEGRGRFKRVWISPKGCNLYVTYVFFVKNLEISNLPQVLALSVFNVLQNGVKIKWPNDLVIKKKKLGGILCEVVEAKGHYAVVLGLGVNINMTVDALQMIDRPATSLMVELGIPLDKEALSDSIHEEFIANLNRYLKEGFSPFYHSFKRALLHRKGDLIHFSNFQKTIEGRFQGINTDGSLCLELLDGSIKNFTSGELLN